MKRCCLWKKEFEFSLANHNAGKYSAPFASDLPNVVFFQGLADYIGDCGQSPKITYITEDWGKLSQGVCNR